MLYICYFYFFFGSHPVPVPRVKEYKIENGIALGGMVIAAKLVPNAAEKLAKHTRERLEAKKIKLHPLTATIIAIVAAAVSVVSNLGLVRVIDAPARELHISKSFLGLVILPAVLGAVETITAAVHATHQEMDWTIQTSVISSVRTALFTLPITICVAWILRIDTMTLFFDFFHIVLAFLAVLIVNHIFQGQGVEGGLW
jgi:Ca2+:H+ antiporter